MIIFSVAAAVIYSDTARALLQDAFAAGSVFMAEHLVLCLLSTLSLALLCCCMRINRRAAGSDIDPIDHWSLGIRGKPASHSGKFTPLKGRWRLTVGKASVKPEDKKLMTGPMYGRQVWVCDDPEAAADPSATFDTTENANAHDKIYHAQMGCPPSRPRSAAAAANVTPKQALEQGVSFFQKLQSPDGHWPADYGGPMFLMPGLVIATYISGAELSAAHKDAMITYLKNHQQTDGGWGLHIESPSTMFGTVMNYVAVRLLGMAADDEVAAAARSFIKKNGGATGVPSWGKFWLSTLGVYSWDGLNPIPPELWELPSWFPFHPCRMWCHARMVYLPMSYIYGCRHTAEPTDLIMELRKELYNTRYSQINWRKARNHVSPLDLYSPHPLVLKLLNVILAVYEKCPIRWLRRRGTNFALMYIHAEDRQTNYVDIGPVNKAMNMLSIFYAHGAHSEEFKAHVPRVLDYLWVAEDGMRMQGYNGSQLWDTAFAAQAVTESGIVHSLPSARQLMEDANRFVKNSQVAEDVQFRSKFFRHISDGGFPFSTADHGWPIADCTSEGLKAALCYRSLGLPNGMSDSRMFAAVNVMLSLQNGDGGWATYENTRGWRWFESLNPAEVFGDIMIDYSYVELTSAVITGLTMFRKEFPKHRSREIQRAIQRGVDFVARVQRADGSWYGSWAVCFTYGTWFGVEALMAGGATPDSEPILRACKFLASKQNKDGGWGESYLSCVTRSYQDNKQEGSQVVNTAWALLTLTAAQYADVDVVERGIKFLISRQLEDGDWQQESVSGVFNRSCAITYTTYRNTFPLWALGRYMTEYTYGPGAAGAHEHK